MKVQDQHKIKPETQSCQMAVSGSVTASELRIGNLLECFGIREVVAIKKNKVKIENETEKGQFILEWTSVKSLSLKPIPLTEDWLLKFGFNCINRPKMAFKLYHNEVNADYSSLILKQVGNNPIWGYAGNNRWTINSFTVEIKYVHQLQNIYFTLTGSDLKVVV
jgi:hypothetical protein